MRKHMIKRSAFDIVFEALVVIIAIVSILLVLYPFLYIASVSLSDSKEVLKNAVTVFPRNITVKAYTRLFEMGIIQRPFMNSVFYTIVGTIISTTLTITMAYALSRKNAIGNKFFSILVAVPMFFAGGIVPLYMVVGWLGLTDTAWAIWLPWAVLSYYVILARAFFEDLPVEILESASIDGANDLMTFFRIVIPISTTVIATTSLFYAIWQWNDFKNALFYLFDKDKFPLSLALKDLLVTSSTSQDTMSAHRENVALPALQSAAIMITVIPIMLLYPFLQKYFKQGVTMGSVKG